MTAMCEVETIESTEDGRYRLGCRQWQEESSFVHETDAVVLGTGYHRPTPSFLDPIVDRIVFNEQGRYRITEDYRIKGSLLGWLFVQNGEVHTHGSVRPISVWAVSAMQYHRTAHWPRGISH